MADTVCEQSKTYTNITTSKLASEKFLLFFGGEDASLQKLVVHPRRDRESGKL